MGIDLEKRGRKKYTGRTSPQTQNLYVRLLARLYGFLARRTDSKFNETVLNRLFMSRNNRPPVSIKRVAKAAKRSDASGKIIVVVGTVTGDVRGCTVPKKTSVCALRFTESARKAILSTGGECLTFDELAVREPKGSDTILLRGPLKSRKAFKHFAGKPYTRAKGRKFERSKFHGKVKRNKRALKKA